MGIFPKKYLASITFIMSCAVSVSARDYSGMVSSLYVIYVGIPFAFLNSILTIIALINRSYDNLFWLIFQTSLVALIVSFGLLLIIQDKPINMEIYYFDLLCFLLYGLIFIALPIRQYQNLAKWKKKVRNNNSDISHNKFPEINIKLPKEKAYESKYNIMKNGGVSINDIVIKMQEDNITEESKIWLIRKLFDLSVEDAMKLVQTKTEE